MEPAPRGAIIYTDKFKEWYRSLNKHQQWAWDLLRMDEYRILTEYEIQFEFPGISEIDMRIERFKRIYKKDFSKEEMQDITSSMRKSLKKYFSEQKL